VDEGRETTAAACQLKMEDSLSVYNGKVIHEYGERGDMTSDD
jgi:hypothetical protein